METKLILTEKDIKRASEEYLIGTDQGKAKSIRLEQGNGDHVSADAREYSAFYAEGQAIAQSVPSRRSSRCVKDFVIPCKLVISACRVST